MGDRLEGAGDGADQHNGLDSQRETLRIVTEPDQHPPFFLVEVAKSTRLNPESLPGS